MASRGLRCAGAAGAEVSTGTAKSYPALAYWGRLHRVQQTFSIKP
jgi:hypothetical protein